IADASLAVASSAGAHTVTDQHVNAAWESCAHTAPAEPEEPRFVRSITPAPVHERGLPPPIRTTVPRRTRRRRARRLAAVALAAALLCILVARAPAWWHRGA